MNVANIKYLLRPLWLGGALLFLSSCTIIPQGNYTMLAEQERQLVTDWPLQEEGTQKATFLKDLIGDPELDSLITEALQANPSLQQTALTLKILSAQRRQATASRLPWAEFDVSAEKEEGKKKVIAARSVSAGKLICGRNLQTVNKPQLWTRQSSRPCLRLHALH